MTKEEFKAATYAGPFARRSARIRAIDDMLARYPSVLASSPWVQSLAVAQIRDACVEWRNQLLRTGRSSKRFSGVFALQGQAERQLEYLKAARKAKGAVRKKFRHAMKSPKFKQLGAYQEDLRKAGPNAKAIDDETFLEVLDSFHRAGHTLEKIHQDWMTRTLPLNFWDFLEQYLRNHPETARQAYKVKYLEENERRAYEVHFRGGRLQQGEGDESTWLDTRAMAVNSPRPENVWGWGIFVQDTQKRVYSGGSFSHPRTKPEGGIDFLHSGDIFHHSSFLNGRPVLCAGEWHVRMGVLQCVTPRSGHYRPPVHLFKEFLLFLRSKGILLDRLAVAWPWPNYNDRRYYNADLFVHANQVVFARQPCHNGSPLPELSDSFTQQGPRRQLPPLPPRGPRATLVIPR
jgi:hypothetical protein